jgi:type I restriction enzyme M protein
MYMYGAILGDIVGSRFEFNNLKSKDFEFITKDSEITDDSIMTIAIKKVLDEYSIDRFKFQKSPDIDSKEFRYKFEKDIIIAMRAFGRKYPNGGYGGHFFDWLFSEDSNLIYSPYNSCGNGSAMRVSSVINFAETLEEAETLAMLTAEVTHNHPEGIRGAQAIAGAGFLLKAGSSKEDVKKYIEHKYYDLNFTLDGIRKSYSFYETCQDSVPQAIVAFLESNSLEDAIRNAVSIGGDSDTIACIAGALAEAFYGITEEQKKMVTDKLPEDLKEIMTWYVSFKPTK